MHRASCAFYHVFLNRHGPRERLRDSRSPDSQHLQQRLEVLPLGRCLSSPAQLHDSRLRGAPLACRSEEHTSELQSLRHLVCRRLLEKKKCVNRASIALRTGLKRSTCPTCRTSSSLAAS